MSAKKKGRSSETGPDTFTGVMRLSGTNFIQGERLSTSLRELDSDDSVGANVLTGSQKAFTAGADIKEMVDHEFAQAFQGRYLEEWTALSETSKPVVAAVNEGWWNSKVGTSTWKVYGHRCLAANRVSAQETKECGLVSKVLPAEQVVNEAVKLGEKISEQSPLIVQMVKEAVNNAYETTLKEGLRYERWLCRSTFATNDCKEGMKAFAEKRAPKWTST